MNQNIIIDGNCTESCKTLMFILKAKLIFKKNENFKQYLLKLKGDY